MNNAKIDSFIVYMQEWNPEFAYESEMINFKDFWAMKEEEFNNMNEFYIIEALFVILDSIKLKKNMELLSLDLTVLAKTDINSAIANIDILIQQLRAMIQTSSGSGKVSFITDVKKISTLKERYKTGDNNDEGYY